MNANLLPQDLIFHRPINAAARCSRKLWFAPCEFVRFWHWQTEIPGNSAQTTLNLTPGNYALVCFIPDPATGKSHAALGMIQGFTVK